MNGTCRNEYMDTMIVGALYRSVDLFDIGRIATRQATDHRAEIPLTVGNPVGIWKMSLGLLAAVALGWIAWRAMHNRRRPRLV